MALKDRKKVLLAKLEQTYGADATPTGQANAIQLRSLSLTPLDGEIVERNILRPGLGAEPAILAGRRARLECEVELAGSKTAGSAPAFASLLQGCAMAETVDSPGKTVSYLPMSNSEPSLTLWFHIDGLRQKLTGARGDMTISLSSANIPVVRFTYTGLWAAVDAASLPTADFSRFADPVVPSKVNTPTFTLHGFGCVPSELELTLGNEVSHVDFPNSAEVRRPNRSGSGRVTIETPALGDKDYFAIATAGTVGDLIVEHGVGAGKTVRMEARCQLTAPAFSETNGVSMLGMDMRLIPTGNGDDELKLIFK